MTRNVPMNHAELAIVLSAFEGQPTADLSHDQFADRRAVHSKFLMAFDGVVLVEDIIKGLPEDFRFRVYDTYHDTKNNTDESFSPEALRTRARIRAVKMVYERLGRKGLREAKMVAEAIGGEISS